MIQNWSRNENSFGEIGEFGMERTNSFQDISKLEDSSRESERTRHLPRQQ